MRTHRTALVAALLAPGLLLAGCGGDDSPASEESPAASTSASPDDSGDQASQEANEDAAEDGQVIEVTISGDSVEPNGDRIEVDVDQPVILDITADRAGELHVHSTPEQEIEFDEGTTKAELTFEQPGMVEVEEHESDRVLLQLEVS